MQLRDIICFSQQKRHLAILGFPIIVPQLLVLMKISNTVFVTNMPIPTANILLLLGSDALVILLAIVLFPFLWKD